MTRFGRPMTIPFIAVAALGAFAACRAPNSLPELTVTPRGAWADAEPIADRLVEHEPRRLTIHHAGVLDDGATAGDQKMRNLLSFSLRDRPWGDVPYHYVIDRQGTVFEGRDSRYAPDTNTGYDVSGHVGICVNGDLTRQPLLEEQYRTLVDLLVVLTDRWNIPDERIAGHLDVSPGNTTCPGVLEQYIRDGSLIADMQSIRKGVRFEFHPREYAAIE